MSGRMPLKLSIFAAIVFASGAFALVHFRGKGSQPVVAFTPIAHSAPPRAAGEPSSETKAVSGDPARKKRAADADFSPIAGEVLVFSANVAKVNNVASLRLEVVDNKQVGGKGAWHFQATAHTQNPLRLVFALDDQFDSYSEGNSFTSVQYEMRLNERGQKVDSIQHMTTTGTEPPPPGTSAARVLPGTRDPLGLMQYLRSVNWDKTPEVAGPVFDGHKLYDVRAKLIGTSEVAVPAGKFTAATIEIHVFDGGTEMKDTHFMLYLAQDGARTPVLLQAALPFAEARVELQKRSD
jgi:hypothetical protein